MCVELNSNNLGLARLDPWPLRAQHSFTVCPLTPLSPKMIHHFFRFEMSSHHLLLRTAQNEVLDAALAFSKNLSFGWHLANTFHPHKFAGEQD